jgi:hypothetical protein
MKTTVAHGAGFQPSNVFSVPVLGRCPRLVWHRAFGPVFGPNGAKHTGPGHLSQGFTPSWYAMLRWSNFSSPNGAKHTSPGQRPGSKAPTFQSPEGAIHLPHA